MLANPSPSVLNSHDSNSTSSSAGGASGRSPGSKGSGGSPGAGSGTPARVEEGQVAAAGSGGGGELPSSEEAAGRDPVPMGEGEGRGTVGDPMDTEGGNTEGGTGLTAMDTGDSSDGSGGAAPAVGEGGAPAVDDRKDAVGTDAGREKEGVDGAAAAGGKTAEDGTNTTDSTSDSDDDDDDDVNEKETGNDSVVENNGGGDAASDDDDDEDDEENDATSGEDIKKPQAEDDIKKSQAEKTGPGGEDEAGNEKSGGEEGNSAKNGGEADGKAGNEGGEAGLKPASSSDPASAPPAAAAPIVYPLLTGTLAYASRDSVRRSVMRGNWRYENSHAAPPQAFELARTLGPDEEFPKPGLAPAGGTYAGGFGVQHAVKTSKGKLKMRSRTVPETGVRLDFVKRETKVRTREEGDSDDESDDENNDGDRGKDVYDVNGKGTNEFGVFELFGTATEEKADGDGDGETPSYRVELRKRYVGPPPVPPPGAAASSDAEGKKKKDGKKRKNPGDPDGDLTDGDLPPPTSLEGEGVCLSGKLVRHTSEELSLDHEVVHRITGLWAMGGPGKIADDPDSCERFEYEHKCSGNTNSSFPLSGRYLGHFYVSDHGTKTKVAERDVTFRFRRNSAGYHNVEGRGSNFFGRYTISGTLTEDGVFTVFRHFQAPKLKVGKKKPAAAAGAVGGAVGEGNKGGGAAAAAQQPANGSAPPKKSSSAKSGAGVGAPAAPAASASGTITGQPPSTTPLTFDDVNSPPAGSVPAPHVPPANFTAMSRGVLKIEADGTHTCSGSWAMTSEHFAQGITSRYHFGLGADHSGSDAEAMLERMDAEGVKDDDRRVKDALPAAPGGGSTPVTPGHSTFPIDSVHYKGNFKLRKGVRGTQTIKDNQIVLKYVKNTGGSYNVYGKGTNEMGTFDLVGTLILQGRTTGQMQLYRMYPPPPALPAGALPPAPAASAPAGNAARRAGGKSVGKRVFAGGLTEKAPENSGPVPAMRPPEPFVPSMSGLQRRESTRMVRLPSRLEEDDPQATMDRVMDRCRQILREVREADAQRIFAAPVDPGEFCLAGSD